MKALAIELAENQGIAQFNDVLSNVIRKGNNFATLHIACIEPLLLGKKNAHKGRIYRHTVGLRVEIATDSVINSYESRYNRDLEKGGYEATYSIKPHAYAVRYGNDSAAMHHHENGQPYMRYFKQRIQSGAECYFTIDSVDGERIAESDIIGLKPAKENIMPETKGNDGKPQISRPFYRLVKVGNIQAINAGGQHVVASDWQAVA